MQNGGGVKAVNNFTPHLNGVERFNADPTSPIDVLRRTGVHIKFLSLEPLLVAKPRLKLRGIDWVIVGGGFGHA